MPLKTVTVCSFPTKRLPHFIKSNSVHLQSVLRLSCLTTHACLSCVIISSLIPKSSQELSPPFLFPSARPVRLPYSHSEGCIVLRSYKALTDSWGKRRESREPASNPPPPPTERCVQVAFLDTRKSSKLRFWFGLVTFDSALKMNLCTNNQMQQRFIFDSTVQKAPPAHRDVM